MSNSDVTVNPSYSQLRQALEDIRQMTVGTGDNPDNQLAALCRIYTLATEALARKPVTQVSKYNVADMQGNPIDDRVIDGQANMPLPSKPWDLRDEDGDLHSPAWYIEAFITVREVYLELSRKDKMDDEQLHMESLDDAHTEMKIYEGYVNKLFGYSDE